MCCYRDRTVSAISYEHLGSYIFFLLYAHLQCQYFISAITFYFHNYSFCVSIQKTQTLAWVWGKSKPSRLDCITIGIVKAISFLFF